MVHFFGVSPLLQEEDNGWQRGGVRKPEPAERPLRNRYGGVRHGCFQAYRDRVSKAAHRVGAAEVLALNGDLDLSGAAWRKSSFSGAPQQNCVEVAEVGGGWVAVRDSKDAASPILVFTPAEWAAFLQGVRAGEFG